MVIADIDELSVGLNVSLNDVQFDKINNKWNKNKNIMPTFMVIFAHEAGLAYMQLSYNRAQYNAKPVKLICSVPNAIPINSIKTSLDLVAFN